MQAAPTPGGVTALNVLWLIAHAINFVVPLNLTYVDLVKTVEVRYKRALIETLARDSVAVEADGREGEEGVEKAPLSHPPAFSTIRVHRKLLTSNNLLGAALGFFMAWASVFSLVTILYGTLAHQAAEQEAVVKAFADRWITLSAIIAAGTVILTHHEYRFARFFAVVSVTSIMVVLFAHRRTRGSTTSTFDDLTLSLNLITVCAAAAAIAIALRFLPSLNGPLMSGLGFGTVIAWAAQGWSADLWGVVDDYVVAFSLGAALSVVAWLYEQCIFGRVAAWARDHATRPFWVEFWTDVAAHNAK